MLNITIDKVRHIEDKDANVRETLVELQHALDKSEQERHFYDALCIDYTAAYLCDLMADTMYSAWQKSVGAQIRSSPLHRQVRLSPSPWN